MKNALTWPAIIFVSAVGAGLMVAMGSQSPLRPAVIFWFILVCPGMAFTRLLPIKSFISELTVAVAGSIVLDTLVTEVMIYTRQWSPEWGVLTLIGLSAIGVGLQLWLAFRSAADPSAGGLASAD